MLRACKYDSSGFNQDWKNLPVDLRAELRKFIKDANPQWKEVETPKIEEICRKIKAKILQPEKVIK